MMMAEGAEQGADEALMAGLARLDPKLAGGEPHVWLNPHRLPAEIAFRDAPSPRTLVDEAELLWASFAPLLVRLFPELEDSHGTIVSPLLDLGMKSGQRVLVKADHLLPLTGTIKARGGVFEVLTYARRNAIEHGLIAPDTPLARLADADLRAHFSRFRLATGSTGNLGYSVGLAARALGFQVEIHMSADAKAWKVERLRALGVDVLQHAGDFSAAVATARAASVRENSYFIDDEDSLTLFQGYSAAALEVQRQIAALGITVSSDHPLIAYLPCGVGGSPGGVAFGLKHLFGDAAFCVLVEPVAAPSVLLQVAVGADQPISVYDVGLDNRTIADGMAVPAASLLAVRHIHNLVDAFVTVADRSLIARTNSLWTEHSLRLEPSGAAGAQAMVQLGDSVLRPDGLARATQLVWTTGGSQLPEAEFQALLHRASST